ncbi:MAG TPA: hypothetical protein VFV17_07155 [Usitatibacteraceae bacterium]|nr:hypothetical protein [Usitatibacteraceae bacterium]
MRVVLVFAVLIAVMACTRTADDESRSRPPRYAGTAPWTIHGVVPGDSKLSIEQRFGKGEQVGIDSLRTSRWPGKGLTVKFDAQERAIDVHGNYLTAGDTALAYDGLPEADVAAALGKGERKGHRAPQAAGVIGLGSTETGSTLFYENGGNQVELTFHKGSFRGVRLTPSPDR